MYFRTYGEVCFFGNIYIYMYVIDPVPYLLGSELGVLVGIEGAHTVTLLLYLVGA
jgi:hypothetical protein